MANLIANKYMIANAVHKVKQSLKGFVILRPHSGRRIYTVNFRSCALGGVRLEKYFKINCNNLGLFSVLYSRGRIMPRNAKKEGL
jgi:hypothetical protein